MLSDKLRPTLRHVPFRRKWAAFSTGIVYLPRYRVAGGWGAGWQDFRPWRLESFTLQGDVATVRSLADGRITRTIQRRMLEVFEDC